MFRTLKLFLYFQLVEVISTYLLSSNEFSHCHRAKIIEGIRSPEVKRY